MLISYNWLQSYFDAKLPPPEKLAEAITFSFAEVEAVQQRGDDSVFDIKVLPDRACYALSHRGFAYEVSAILGLPQKSVEYPAPEVRKTRALSVRVEAPELCGRYMARVVEQVNQEAMPWVSKHLEAVGQRSVNPVVDGANLVMFDRGQPLHAFDADKVEGGIVVRLARAGETITTLDNRLIALDASVLVIADERSPLALAGIKGGKKAEVTSATCNLILESANFDASYIRKTSQRLGIKTEASKRFENGCSLELAGKGLDDFAAYLFEMDKSAFFGETSDVRHSDIPKNVRMSVTPAYIRNKLGADISESDISDALARLQVGIEKSGSENKWMLTVPVFRADVHGPEDIAEEVARIIGYDKIPSALPPKAKAAEIEKNVYYEWKIRAALAAAGFSEVMTSSFSNTGSIAIEKPLAEDKKYARENLRAGFEKALAQNLQNAPLFGHETVRIFEVGHIFTKHGERTALAIGVAGAKKKSAGLLESAVSLLCETLGREAVGESTGGVFECVLDEVFEELAKPRKWDIEISPAPEKKFEPFSLFPCIVRDVALFVSPDTTAESVAGIIREHAGDLVVRGPELFDEFSKDGRKSLAFRLVFQSFNRTLSDEEVNKRMEKVYVALAKRGWRIR